MEKSRRPWLQLGSRRQDQHWAAGFLSEALISLRLAHPSPGQTRLTSLSQVRVQQSYHLKIHITCSHKQISYVSVSTKISIKNTLLNNIQSYRFQTRCRTVAACSLYYGTGSPGHHAADVAVSRLGLLLQKHTVDSSSWDSQL